MFTIRSFRSADEPAMIDLWTRCGLVKPQNDPRKDIQRKSKVRPDLVLVGEFDGQLVASIMIGYEGHRGWINYLAVSPDHQKRGFGRHLMEEAERLLCAERLPEDQSPSPHLQHPGSRLLPRHRLLPRRRRSPRQRLEHD